MTIRRANPGDHQALVELTKEFDESSQTTLPAQHASFRQATDLDAVAQAYADNYTSDDYITFVAETDGRVVGYICGYMRDKPHRRYHREGHIEDFFVRAEHRRSGIGRRLFDALCVELTHAGADHLTLSAHVSNSGAIRFYERDGFIPRTVSFIKPLDR
jgi:ribosomal protein S18 acetylase RimI-like enzyme